MQLLASHRTDRRTDRARQVRELVRAELFSGVFNSRALPDEAQLVARYGCSRNALREALAMLNREGLIERIPGAGTFATSQHEANRHDYLEGLSEQLNGTSRVHVVPMEIRLGPAPAAVASALCLGGEDVVCFERRLFLDGAPSGCRPVTSGTGGRVIPLSRSGERVLLLDGERAGRGFWLRPGVGRCHGGRSGRGRTARIRGRSSGPPPHPLGATAEW